MSSPNKTQPTPVDPIAFLEAVPNPNRRRDGLLLHDLFTRITGESAVMWGPSIIGYGIYHYRYASGRSGSAGAAGFSPRAAATSVYLPDGVGAHAALLDKLGPHRAAVGCLYIKDVTAIDLSILEQIVRTSYETVTAGTFGSRAADS